MKHKEIWGDLVYVVPHRYVLSCTVSCVTFTSNLNSGGHQSQRPNLVVHLLEHHGEEQISHQEFHVPKRKGGYH